MRALLALCLLLAACAMPTLQPLPRGPIGIAVAQRGWHTEIGIPASSLNGPLSHLGPANLHRSYLLIGYGARNFFTNPKAGAGTAFEALFPGPAAINLAAFNNLDDASEGHTVWLYVTQEDINQMLAFIWSSMPHTGAAPQPIVTANNASMFYRAKPDYDVLYNCNNWAVDALRAAGLPFSNAGVHFSSDVQAEARRIARAQHSGAQTVPSAPPGFVSP